MKDKAGGAAERARGPVWYKRPPKAKRRRAAGMQEREKVLANSSFVCYTLFDAKITKKGAAEMKTLHDNKMNKFRAGNNRISVQQLSL